jgi:hypothetical protein
MLEQLWMVARQHYSEVRLYVFSDHGMANCDECLDLKRAIRSLPVRMPQDYVAVYDSTMARFWFFNGRAREVINDCLARIPQGRILPEAELKQLGVFFPDHYFGEVIFLVKEGALIVPSDMGERPIRAMHGYHPSEKHSFAALCTNQEQIPADVRAIPDMFRLMVRDAELAKARNGKTPASGMKPGNAETRLAGHDLLSPALSSRGGERESPLAHAVQSTNALVQLEKVSHEPTLRTSASRRRVPSRQAAQLAGETPARTEIHHE